jgi:Fe-S cluster assembly ATP-binding protein
MIDALSPDAVLRLGEGRIAQSGGLELAHEIGRSGYAAHAELAQA